MDKDVGYRMGIFIINYISDIYNLYKLNEEFKRLGIKKTAYLKRGNTHGWEAFKEMFNIFSH